MEERQEREERATERQTDEGRRGERKKLDGWDNKGKG